MIYFKLSDDYYLIPTAEVPLTNLFRNQILDIDKLPLKLTAVIQAVLGPSWELWKRYQGLIRQHQFEKVELVQICHPDHSFKH